MDTTRRDVLVALTAIGASALVPGTAAAGQAPAMQFNIVAAPALDPIPALPKSPTPGKVGDFNFLAGRWRIANLMKRPSGWDSFPGESTVYPILNGVGSVEELRIPARDFSGMGLRLLDIEKRVWSDYWVNAKNGVVTTPGQSGSFENGAGIFSSAETEKSTKTIYVGVWDKITPSSCRWRQAASTDDGKTWTQSWLMEWTRM